MAKDRDSDLPKVTVLVVSYNTAGHLRDCLAGLDGVHEVIVVDNASTDGSAALVAESFPDVRLIANKTNRGFGAANNQGLDVMTGDVALLLNSDAVPTPGAVEELARAMLDPTVVACGGRLTFPDGRAQNSACGRLTLWRVWCEQMLWEKIFPFSRWLNGYWLNDWIPSDRTTEVEQVMGACLMIHPVERFDERFFLYCEDTELCRRLRGHGRIVYVPSAVFTHELGASSSSTRWESVARYNRGKELYFSIHHSPFAGLMCFVFDRCGAALRLMLYCLFFGYMFISGDYSKFKNITLWWQVLTAPRLGPPRPPDS
ncbi:MAG: glycosyltransferase family 2 protein [Armatimonadetes bacterium]|nr:glycosyltransferase family 2 protein [Armatimonadota bacterium]